MITYPATIAVYHSELGKNLDRISSKLLKYTNNIDWNGINFRTKKRDYKTFEKNNDTIPLNIFFVPFNEKNILPEYVSKHNFTRKVQISLLKITDGENKWHFLALKSNTVDNSHYMNSQKSFSRLMKGISSNTHENHYCFGCFHSFRTQSALENILIYVKTIVFAKQSFLQVKM